MLMVPGKLFTAFWLKQGILPLWNPTIFAGLPWIGDVNQSVLYPTTLLFTFLHPSHAVNITLIAHLTITFLGTYFLSFKLSKNHWGSMTAAVIWSFSTQLTGALHNLSSIQSIIWLPWIVLAGLSVFKKESKKGKNNSSIKTQLIFALLVMVHFLGGYPQHVIFSILLAVAFSFFITFWGLNTKKKHKVNWSLFKQWTMSWFYAGILSVGLTAFIWLPFMEVLQDSTRITQSQDQSTSGSLHPVDFAKIILPYSFDKPAEGMKWGPKWNAMPNLAFYITWLGLLLPFLVFIRKKAKKIDIFLLLVTTATVLFAMGEYLPGYEFLQIVIPLFRFSRGPSTILMLTNLVLAVWIAIIIGRYSKKKLFGKNDFKILLGLGVVAAISSLGIWVLVHYQFDQFWILLNQVSKNAFINSPFHTVPKDIVIFEIFTQNLLVNSILFVIALGLFYKKRFLILFIIIALDLIYNTSGNLFFAPNDVYVTLDDPRQEKLLKEFPQLQDYQSRTLIRNFNTPYTDFGAYFEALTIREPFSDSFINQKELETYNNLKHRAIGFTPDWNMPANVQTITGYTTMIPQQVDTTWNDLELVDNYSVSINDLPEIKTTNPELHNWATKYYLVDTWFDTTQEDFSHLEKLGEYESWELYEMSDILSRFRYEDGTEALLEKRVETANDITIQIRNRKNHSHLIVADRYDKNWQAVVNGKAAELENHNGMIKLEIVEGKNNVELRYVPKKFYKGLAISGLILSAGLLTVLVEKRSS